MFNPKRPASRLPILLLALALAYTAGFYRAGSLAGQKVGDLVRDAEIKGISQGLANQDWKDHAKSDQVFTDKLCSAWWFDLEHTDRKIRLTNKPKRL